MKLPKKQIITFFGAVLILGTFWSCSKPDCMYPVTGRYESTSSDYYVNAYGVNDTTINEIQKEFIVRRTKDGVSIKFDDAKHKFKINNCSGLESLEVTGEADGVTNKVTFSGNTMTLELTEYYEFVHTYTTVYHCVKQ